MNSTNSSNHDSSSTADALSALIEDPVAEGISRLDAAQRDDLAELIELATRARIEKLTEAAVGALDNIPVLLRGAVRKVVGL
ncbi:hypothetical protein [Nocardia sp. NPDC051570]|uniref:hypothetical protein n=1 Tax=Nocardia sp. NPDC051570 TaxID=3364324 RepID=UPI00379A5A74